MSLRVNPQGLQGIPAAAEAPAREIESAPAKAVTATDAFLARSPTDPARALQPENASTAAVPQRGTLGFEAVAPKAKYDPAGKLFPALEWLDPTTYKPADPSKLPAQQQSEIDLVKAAQAARTPDPPGSERRTRPSRGPPRPGRSRPRAPVLRLRPGRRGAPVH